MARGPRLSPEDEQEVRRIYWSAPDQKSEAVRLRASRSLDRELGLSTVQRLLAQERKKHREQKRESQPLAEIDQPWSIGSLAKYPVARDRIRPLVAMQRGFKAMTIRQALWYDRLFDYFQADVLASGEIHRATWLPWVALLLASYELACESAGVPCDTSRFDDLDTAVLKDRLLEWVSGQDGFSDHAKVGLQRVFDGAPDQTQELLREIEALSGSDPAVLTTMANYLVDSDTAKRMMEGQRESVRDRGEAPEGSR